MTRRLIINLLLLTSFFLASSAGAGTEEQQQQPPSHRPQFNADENGQIFLSQFNDSKHVQKPEDITLAGLYFLLVVVGVAGNCVVFFVIIAGKEICE